VATANMGSLTFLREADRLNFENEREFARHRGIRCLRSSRNVGSVRRAHDGTGLPTPAEVLYPRYNALTCAAVRQFKRCQTERT
jgi:hypothetical protein